MEPSDSTWFAGDMTQDGRQYPDMWVDPAQDPRESDTTTRGEKATLLDYLRHYRLTLELKCEGLTPVQLATRSVPPSTMSLLGLIRHLAAVEHSWFCRVMARDLSVPKLYGKDADRDADFDGAVGTEECVAEAFSAWRAEIAKADAYLATASVDDLGTHSPDDELELRDVVVHLIEEYARHAGHADLLRECIDGRTGQ